MKRRLTCFCEAKFDADVPEVVDLAKKPETEDQILSGEFLAFRCPACGKVVRPEFPVHIVDRSRNINIFLIPELDRVSFYRNSLLYGLKDASRVVIGFAELVEKIRLYRSNLNDEAIEVIKYYLLKKGLEDSETEEEVQITFHSKEKNSLIFHARGFKQDEIGVLRVDEAMAARVADQLVKKRKEQPFDLILKGPYISINKILSEFQQ